MSDVTSESNPNVFMGGEVDGLRSRLILRSDDRMRYSYDRVEDCRTALARGLKEYLERLTLNWAGGRLLKFETSAVEWAAPEEPAKYPALSIVGEGPGAYEASELSPRLIKLDKEQGDGTGRFLRESCELKQNFSVLVWATDDKERSGLVAGLEDLLEPVDFMTGVRLELPYYFNSRATYEKLSVFYIDDGDASLKRWKRAILMVAGNLPQLVPVGELPLFRPQVVPDVTDSAAAASSATIPWAPDIEGVVITGEKS